ncbi:phage terminase, large subunit, PBSX family, partial [gut metagenome]
RGGDYSLVMESFNPPPTMHSWVNLRCAQPAEGRLVHRSDYRSVPPEWLGKRFLRDAETLRRQDETAFRNEYLGEAVGSGRMVFLNLRLEPVTDGEIACFERRYHGVDWGWFPDPWAFNSCAYDPARRILTVWDEATALRTGNEQTAGLLIKKGVMQGPEGTETLYADSAEPKSCGDYRAMGLGCRAAVKGPGSLAAGMKWLQGLCAIRIDPVRCPDTAREFARYEYRTNPHTGEVLPGWPDRDNHHIDAVRYAMSEVWRRRG